MRAFIQDVLAWVAGVVRHWAVLASGAAATVILTVLGQGFRIVAAVWIVAFFVACFLAWRDERRQHLFTPVGREMFTGIMRAHPQQMPQIFVVYHVDLRYGRRYASDLVAALSDAGWDAKIWRHPTSNLEINRRGIWVCGEQLDARELVIAAFRAAQYEAKIERSNVQGQAGIVITIGEVRFPIGP
jgi:hypothetical protein